MLRKRTRYFSLRRIEQLNLKKRPRAFFANDCLEIPQNHTHNSNAKDLIHSTLQCRGTMTSKLPSLPNVVLKNPQRTDALLAELPLRTQRSASHLRRSRASHGCRSCSSLLRRLFAHLASALSTETNLNATNNRMSVKPHVAQGVRVSSAIVRMCKNAQYRRKQRGKTKE